MASLPFFISTLSGEHTLLKDVLGDGVSVRPKNSQKLWLKNFGSKLCQNRNRFHFRSDFRSIQIDLKFHEKNNNPKTRQNLPETIISKSSYVSDLWIATNNLKESIKKEAKSAETWDVSRLYIKANFSLKN